MNTEVEPDEVIDNTEIEEVEIPLYSGSTACEHFMVQDSPDTAVCNKGCGHGVMFNQATDKIENGIISVI